MSWSRLAIAMLLLAGCGHEGKITDETRAREVFMRQLAEREGLVDIWSLMSRSNLQFEDGLAPLETISPVVPLTSWRDKAHSCTSVPGKAVRWMGPRAHLRVRGEGDQAMRLEIRGRVDLLQLATRPLITANLDGVEFHADLVDLEGYFRIAATIPSERLRGWSDIYITVSSVHEPWRDPAGLLGGKLTVARLEGVTWEPAAAPSAALRPRSP